MCKDNSATVQIQGKQEMAKETFAVQLPGKVNCSLKCVKSDNDNWSWIITQMHNWKCYSNAADFHQAEFAQNWQKG